MSKKKYYIFVLFGILLITVMLIKRPTLNGLGENKTLYFSGGKQQVVSNGNNTDEKFSVLLSALGEGYKGESVELCGGAETVEYIIEKYNAEVIFIEKVEDITVYYCYSPHFTVCERIGGKNINLQIAANREKVTVGCPVIYGGY